MTMVRQKEGGEKSARACLEPRTFYTGDVFFFFLVGYVEERPWWPIQSPNKGRKKKASS